VQTAYKLAPKNAIEIIEHQLIGVACRQLVN
jgi:hypothetical protein